MSTVYFCPQFLSPDHGPHDQEALQASIAIRHATLRKHRDHEVVRALGEFLDLQAARMTLESVGEQVINREYACGQAAGVSYVAAVLRSILDKAKMSPETDEG
jgi:hypothetical protein